MSSEDDESGGEGHSGGYSTDDVFVYDGVSVGDGLDDLDSTPPECGGTQAAVPSSTSCFQSEALQPARLVGRDHLWWGFRRAV